MAKAIELLYLETLLICGVNSTSAYKTPAVQTEAMLQSAAKTTLVRHFNDVELVLSPKRCGKLSYPGPSECPRVQEV